jgi:hypothetical protein
MTDRGLEPRPDLMLSAIAGGYPLDMNGLGDPL